MYFLHLFYNLCMKLWHKFQSFEAFIAFEVFIIARDPHIWFSLSVTMHNKYLDVIMAF